MPAVVRQLTPADADRFTPFRRRMLEEAPWAFSADPEDDVALDADFVREALGRAEQAVFAVDSRTLGETAAHDNAVLVATAGILRARSPKFAHRAKLWGVYVDPAHRRRGLGRAVVTAALELAASWQGVDYVDLGVSERSPEARALYESLGFVVWGREPEATAHGGRRWDELHMTLGLARPGPEAPRDAS
jgi:ribosomal protein S18 acetylase RimI-like enzyme